jgi:hypothetical protein
MTLRFEVNPVTPPVGGTATTLLTVVATGAQLGNHTITIVGNAGALNRSATFNARVSGGCLIATATYESELSDEVQFLREFRDNSILKTNAGSSFMTAFNSWYCSFSPTVAGFIREHSTARVTAKALLYPLVWILRFAAGAFALSPTNPEVGAVLSGLVASSLIGGVYFGPPLTILLACSRRLRRSARGLAGCSLAILIGAVAIVTLASTFGVPSLVMMIATCAIVLACVAVFALFTSMAAFYVGRRTCRGLGALFPVRSPTRG